MMIIEGEKFVRDAGGAIEFVFGPGDTDLWSQVISTETPQVRAAVVRVPEFSLDDVLARPNIIVLDGVQDPGNVGTIVRTCLAFNASLLLIESADVTSPKVVRSTAAAVLTVPWMVVARGEAIGVIERLGRPVYRLELGEGNIAPKNVPMEPAVFIAGSEGQGIKLPIAGVSVTIDHSPDLESLNVAQAVSIMLYERNR